MEISEQDLRTLVREAIARHLGRPSSDSLAELTIGSVESITGFAEADSPHPTFRVHASHAILILPPQPVDTCIIEPAVTCDHCGYCKSLGH